MSLPPGFELDQSPNGLPPGFQLDTDRPGFSLRDAVSRIPGVSSLMRTREQEPERYEPRPAVYDPNSDSPIVRGGPIEPLQNGLPMSQATHQRQDFPELPRHFRSMTDEQVLDVARNQLRDADPDAEITQDRYGNKTLTMNGQQYYFNKPGLGTSDVIDAVGKVAGGVKGVAPYLHTGVASAAMKAVPAMVAQAATGFMTEGTNQAVEAMQGGEFDWGEVGKMSLSAFAGEGIGRVVAGGLGALVRGISGSNIRVTNPDGSLTDDAIRVLRENNISPAQADDAVRAYGQQTDALTPEQAERFNLFKRYNMTATRAQVTRTADDFQNQQELMKRSGAVRNAVEEQRGQVNSLMDEVANRGNPAGTSAYEAITNKATQLDDTISALYQEADRAVPTGQGVRLSNLAQSMRDNAGSERVSGGLISSLKGELQARGIIDDTWKIQGRISVRTAEEIRQVLNDLYPSLTDRGRQLVRVFKESLDEDVFRFAGDDIYAQARQAKADFEAGLRNTKNNKWDQNSRSLVRDILENKVNPDRFLEQTVLSTSRRASDLEELKGYLLSGADDQVAVGADAWETLRRDTLDYIRGQAFRSVARGEQGLPELSASGFRNAIKRIGTDKLKVLFNSDELNFINDMLKIAEARTPVDMTFTGKGPTGQAIQALSDRLTDMATNGNSGIVARTLGGFLDYFRAGNVINPNVAGMAEKAAKSADSTRRAIRSVGGATGAYEANR